MAWQAISQHPYHTLLRSARGAEESRKGFANGIKVRDDSYRSRDG
jgi:hypothetical protein